MLLVILTTFRNLAGPYLIGQAIDDYILPGDLPGLARLCLLMLTIYLTGALLTWLQVYLMAAVAQRTIRDIRADLFDQLQTLSLRYFDQHAARRPHEPPDQRCGNGQHSAVRERQRSSSPAS